MIYQSTKYFKEIGPCAYRNHKSDTDCYLLHGYCRSFRFVFGCNNLDRQGFVVDFGGLKDVKRQLQEWFDHTVILQSDDPLISTFRQLDEQVHESERLGECHSDQSEFTLQSRFSLTPFFYRFCRCTA